MLVNQYFALQRSTGASVQCSWNCNPARVPIVMEGYSLVGTTQQRWYDTQEGLSTLAFAPMDDMLLYRITADRYSAYQGQNLRLVIISAVRGAPDVAEVKFHLSNSSMFSSPLQYTVPSLDQALEVKVGDGIAWCTTGAGVFDFVEDTANLTKDRSDLPSR
jgi:hypothetical protein